MPKLLADLVSMINRMPLNAEWKRLRIAITEDEITELRTFFRSDNGKQFIWAIRGVPLVLEEHPRDPLYFFEILEGGSSSEIGL